MEKNGWEYEIQEPHLPSALGSSVIKGVGKGGARVKQVRAAFPRAPLLACCGL